MVEVALDPAAERVPSTASPRSVVLSSLRRAGLVVALPGSSSPSQLVAAFPGELSASIPSSVPRVGFSKRCVGSVGCVSRVVASCKRPLRPVASASGQVTPKSVLQGTLSSFRRAAPRSKSKRILERLATLGPQSGSGLSKSGLARSGMPQSGDCVVPGSVVPKSFARSVASLLRQSALVSRRLQ